MDETPQTATGVQASTTSACPHPEAVGKRWGDPISVERQAELQARIDAWDASGANRNNRAGPFEKLKLTGADVYWLAESMRGEDGTVPTLNLSIADLEEAHLEGANLASADLFNANLAGAHVERANFRSSGLSYAYFNSAFLDNVDMTLANLRNAVFIDVHAVGANLSNTRLEGADLSTANLGSANIRSAWFDAMTNLFLVEIDEGTRLGDIHWGSVGGVNLTTINWAQVRRLGDENLLTEVDGIVFRELVARAYRQLAAQLRTQGMTEIADRFSYRGQVCQRAVLLREFNFLQYLGSLFLDLISGYGYKPMRSFITYALVVVGFAAAYFALGTASGQHLAWNEAIVISMTAFHGRGFFSAVFQPGDLQAAVAAVEAFIGLLIEIVLIATFTQRFFAR